MGLAKQKVRIKHMPQFVGKKPANHLVAVFAPFYIGHSGASRVDPDHLVICGRCVFFFRLPVQINADPAVIVITAGLRGGHILKMTG